MVALPYQPLGQNALTKEIPWTTDRSMNKEFISCRVNVNKPEL